MQNYSHHTYGVEYRLREDNSVLFYHSFSADEKEFAVPQKAGEKIEIDEKKLRGSKNNS